MRLAILLQLGSTLPLFGIIWFVQIVHYPLFAKVGSPGFTDYEAAHTRLITPVVAPLMLAEVAAVLMLIWLRPAEIGLLEALAGGVLLILIWTSTFLLQLPRHRRLLEGFQSDSHHALILTNWVRTIAWTGRALLTLWMTATVIRP